MLSFLGGSLLSAVTLYQKFFEAVKAHRNPLLLLSIFLFTLGVGSQVLASNHCKLLSLRAMVVSVAGKSGHDPGRYG